MHVSRLITTYLPFFKEDFTPKHTPHKYSDEMCKKSEVVSTSKLMCAPVGIVMTH